MKKELNEKDSKTYMNIVMLGDMDKMFDFGYLCGKEEVLDQWSKGMKIHEPDAFAGAIKKLLI